MAGSGDDRGRLRAAYLDQKDRSSRCSPPPTGPREGRCQRQLPSSARRFRARHRASALSTQEWNELRSAARPPETSRGRSGHGRVQAGCRHAPVQSTAYHLNEAFNSILSAEIQRVFFSQITRETQGGSAAQRKNLKEEDRKIHFRDQGITWEWISRVANGRACQGFVDVFVSSSVLFVALPESVTRE